MDAQGDDVLLIAMTRPATFMNIPLEAAGVIMVLGMVAFGASQNMVWGLVVAAPLYCASLTLVRYDMNAFRLLGLYMQTRYGPGTSRATAKIWGGNSYSPTAIFLARRSGYGEAHGE